MKKNWIECEALIRDIEEIKKNCYDAYCINENRDDASALAQLSQRLLGQQMVCDDIIHMLRGYQGSDDE